MVARADIQERFDSVRYNHRHPLRLQVLVCQRRVAAGL